MTDEWRTAASCSVHGNRWNSDCPACEWARTVTWADNVRVNRPDAPDWLKVWAAAMDGQDRILAAIEGGEK